MTQVVADALAGMNVLLALLMLVMQARLVWECRKNRPPWCWLRIGYVLISAYWAGLYLYVLVTTPGSYNNVLFGQVWVRPAFTFTLALMAAGAIQRGRARQ